ncbi:hypothetical protein G7B40_035095 [Aetokthonos hydrillicola Thurmond2011]|jgi:hypothetical protein|uniref:Uncharacterized protein n=1 Tax=Aetokthonos hydrillicola Thurmond2011 TaxID=2712845 RepID=A0AAP5MCY1_9CYAN|nr:hypothetical protein [Aetokthonos hydrillicola]MBW4590425.1 hypothetical protein [Aetokthonos hydrillicola CCALA 1050]MDR9899747.1 hypothetical protein [Aetokthonos hydrillicola Thurmond2011]
MFDHKTPIDVRIRFEARKPITDPTLGIPVNISRIGTPRNRLVAIGDSVTQGFKSGGIYDTKLSYPAIIAREMGWNSLRYPTYDGPEDGLPLNIERLAENLQRSFGNSIDWFDFLQALLALLKNLRKSQNYWEQGEGSVYPIKEQINHNLAVYGWDLRNTLSRNADICIDVLKKNPPKISLEGIHPTTIGYGIIAQEVIKIMQLAGVKFYEMDGKTQRTGEIQVDFQRVIAEDSLITNPPQNTASIEDTISSIDRNFNILSDILRRNY